MSNTFKTKIVIIVQITRIVCSKNGIIIDQNILNSLAPSILAASRVSFGMPLNAALNITKANPVCIHIIIAIKNRLFHIGIVNHA